MQEEVLLDEASPSGDITALVVQDNRVAYFYLQGQENHIPLRACWIRNLQQAPAEMDIESMRDGLPPLLPAAFCKNSMARPPLNKNHLSVVWFEEGDAAALLEDDEVLVVIPCWSGKDGFSGYALECANQCQICWPLLPDNALYKRIERARKYWLSWEAGTSPWEILRSKELEVLEAGIGQHHSYYSIDGGQWPPCGLVRIQAPEGVVLTTLGVALRPQPTVELYTENPAQIRRVEIGICLSGNPEEDLIMQAAGLMAQMARLPWNAFSWYGHGHTVTCNQFPPEDEISALLFDTDPPGAPEITHSVFMGDPINLLWLIPITAEERTYAQAHSSTALFEILYRAGVTWAYERRKNTAIEEV